MSFIERIRSKSKETRKHIAFAVAFGVTTLVAIVWLTTVPTKFSSIESVKAPASLTDVLRDVKTQAANTIDSFPIQKEPDTFKTSNIDALAVDSSASEIVSTSNVEPVPIRSHESEVGVTVEDEPKPMIILIGTTTRTDE